MKKLNYVNRGISLIVLIITIAVMLIISSVIILSVADNDIVKTTNETAIKSDFQTMIDNYNVIKNDLLFDNAGDESALTDAHFEGKGIVFDKYKSRVKVTKDGIIYIGTDEKEIAIAKELGIKVE